MLLKKDDLTLAVTSFGIDGCESWPVVATGVLQHETCERPPNWQELGGINTTTVLFQALWFYLTLDQKALGKETLREIIACAYQPGRHDLFVRGITQFGNEAVELVLPQASLAGCSLNFKLAWSAVGQDWRLVKRGLDAKQAGLLRLLERLEAEDVTFTMTRGYTLAHGQGERVWVATMARRGTVGAAMGKSMYEALLLAEQRMQSDGADVSDGSGASRE